MNRARRIVLQRAGRLLVWLVLAAVVLLSALLAGCAAPAPQIVRVPVQVPVPMPVPCVDATDLPPPPRLASDAELARLDDRPAVLMLEQQRRLLRDYTHQAAALLAACVRPIDWQPTQENER